MNIVVGLAIVLNTLIVLVSLAKIFSHWKQPAWKAFIPLYNLYILQDIIGRPRWWIICMIIPYLGIVWIFLASYKLARLYHRGLAFAFGLSFLPFIFYPLLAFSMRQKTSQ